MIWGEPFRACVSLDFSFSRLTLPVSQGGGIFAADSTLTAESDTFSSCTTASTIYNSVIAYPPALPCLSCDLGRASACLLLSFNFSYLTPRPFCLPGRRDFCCFLHSHGNVEYLFQLQCTMGNCLPSSFPVSLVPLRISLLTPRPGCLPGRGDQGY